MAEIRNLTGEELDQDHFLKIADIVLKGENILNRNISIVFISPSEMQEINRDYRGKDSPTDVLSFELGGDNWIEAKEQELGEIFICTEEVKKSNNKEEDSAKGISRVLIHGILHLCGYDHEEDEKEQIMKQKENFYLNLCQEQK